MNFVSDLKKVAIAALLVGVATVASAQDEAPERIASVDVERAVLQTDAAKKMIEEFKTQKTVAELYEDFDEKRNAYEAAAEKYAKDRAVMSETKRAEAELELNNMREDLQYTGNKLTKNEEAIKQQIMQQSYQAALQVIENIIKEQEIGLLLRSGAGSSVISASKKYDLTNQVTERLNQISK